MGYLVVTFLWRRYSLSEVLKLLFTYTKFLGSSVIEEVDGQWSVSSSLLAFNFFVSLASALALYLNFLQYDWWYNETYLLKSLLLFEYMLLYVSRIVNMLSQVVNLRQIRLFMKSFKSLEEIFLRIDSKQSIIDGPPLYCFMGNIYILLVYLLSILLQIEFNLINLVKLLNSISLPFIMNVDVAIICVLIHSVEVNLSYLNGYLEALKSNDCNNGKIHDAAVEYCCKAYNHLCSQVTCLNDIGGIGARTKFRITNVRRGLSFLP